MANRAVGNRLSDILKDVEMRLDGVKEQFLLEMAKELTDLSPVDTGDYVMSHKIGTTSIAGQFTGAFRSIGEGGQDPTLFRETAYNGLALSIEALPKDAKTIFIGNNAPHAQAVEEGGANWKRQGYKVYAIVRNRADVYLANAIAKVKGST